MQVGVEQLVAIRRSVQVNALPLSAHIVIGQIGEHAVYAVAAKHYVAVGRALAEQTTINVYAGIVVEIECGARANGECGQAVNKQAPIHHQWLL